AGIRRRAAARFLTAGELDAVSEQELERRGVLVGELADDVAIAVPGRGVIVARPVREDHVGRVDGAIFLLEAVSAPQLDAPAAEDAAAADIEVLLDHDPGR